MTDDNQDRPPGPWRFGEFRRLTGEPAGATQPLIPPWPPRPAAAAPPPPAAPGPQAAPGLQAAPPQGGPARGGPAQGRDQERVRYGRAYQGRPFYGGEGAYPGAPYPGGVPYPSGGGRSGGGPNVSALSSGGPSGGGRYAGGPASYGEGSSYGRSAGPGPYSGSPGPYSGSPGPYSGSPGPYSGSPGPYSGSPGPYSGSPGPYSGSPGPYGGGSAPNSGGSGPYGGSPVSYLGGSAPYGGAAPSGGGPASYPGGSAYGGGAGYPPPGAGARAGGGYPGTPTWSPAPAYPGGYRGWSPPGDYAPWGAPPRRRKPTLGLIVLVIIMVAALVGLEIGGTLVSHRNSLAGGSSGSVARGQGGLPAAQAQSIAAAVDRSVVDVNARLGYQEAAAAGTGMVLSSDGEVVTNNHVIAGETSLSVTVVGGKTYGAKVLGTDPTADVALLQLTGASGLTPITTADPTKLSSGQPIVAVGNAGGVGGTPSVVTGTVAALGQSVSASDLGGGNQEQLSDMIEMNAPLQPGDSGGPLIDASSHVVGMDTAAAADPRFQNQSNLGFAIPINRAVAIAQQIAAGHGSSTVLIGLPGFLGISVSDASTTPGASIDGVLPGSPADKGGLTPGDVITSIDGKAVGSSSALTAVLQQHHAGERVRVGWIDTLGAKHTAGMTLIVGPAA